jgi:hypothetical protein
MTEAKNGPPRGDEELHLEEVRHPETMYDRSDLSSRAIFVFLVGLAIAIALIHILSWGYLRYSARGQLTPVPRSAAIVTPAKQAGKKGEPTLTFPAPQLQPDPVADQNKFRAGVEEQLNSYGWVDQNRGIVHIPIERAIEIVGQEGLPTRQPPALPPRATFGSGDNTPTGAGGGKEPK